MARPKKIGLDYFPVDVVFDDKMEIIEAKFGLEGFAIIIKLWQKIYQEGYYITLNNDTLLIFARKNYISLEDINGIINKACEVNLFDKNIYEKYNILTARGIQKRYIEITKRRLSVEFFSEYLLLNNIAKLYPEKVNVCINSINENINVINECINKPVLVNVDINPVNADINPQSKVKKSKHTQPPPANLIRAEKKPLKNACVCPIEEIKELYHKKLPTLARAENWRDITNFHLRSCWEQSKEYQNLSWWSGIFEQVGKHDFLMRRNQNGKSSMIFDLEWFVEPKNFKKITSGKFFDVQKNKKTIIQEIKVIGMTAEKENGFINDSAKCRKKNYDCTGHKKGVFEYKKPESMCGHCKDVIESFDLITGFVVDKIPY